MDPCCGRPNRSDSHVSKEEEAKIEGETRDYFDGLAPQRHSKPQRSDFSSTYVDGVPTSNAVIPEQLVFQQLEDLDSQKLVYNGSEVREEFVETEYYKDLNCIDKQHHCNLIFNKYFVTGTGFIAVDNAKGMSFNLAPDNSTGCHISSHGNPATNDWIPAANDMVDFASDKPKRSDN